MLRFSPREKMIGRREIIGGIVVLLIFLVLLFIVFMITGRKTTVAPAGCAFDRITIEYYLRVRGIAIYGNELVVAVGTINKPYETLSAEYNAPYGLSPDDVDTLIAKVTLARWFFVQYSRANLLNINSNNVDAVAQFLNCYAPQICWLPADFNFDAPFLCEGGPSFRDYYTRGISVLFPHMYVIEGILP